MYSYILLISIWFFKLAISLREMLCCFSRSLIILKSCLSFSLFHLVGFCGFFSELLTDDFDWAGKHLSAHTKVLTWVWHVTVPSFCSSTFRGVSWISGWTSQYSIFSVSNPTSSISEKRELFKSCLMRGTWWKTIWVSIGYFSPKKKNLQSASIIQMS